MSEIKFAFLNELNKMINLVDPVQLSSFDFNNSPKRELENHIKNLAKEMALFEVNKIKEKGFKTNLKQMLENSPNQNISKLKGKSRSLIMMKNGQSKNNFDEFCNSSNRKKIKASPTLNDDKNLSIYEKNINKNILKEQKLDFLREKKIQMELSQAPFKSNINEKSLKIVKTKLKDNKPIYLRADEILTKKIGKIDKLRTFNKNPSLNKTMINKFSKQKFDTWIDFHKTWDSRRNNKIFLAREFKESLKKDDLKFTYQPQINEVSKSRTYSENCFDRLYNYKDVIQEKKKILEKKLTPKFMPNVDKQNNKNRNLHEPGNYSNFKLISSSYEFKDSSQKSKFGNSVSKINFKGNSFDF